MSEPQTLREFVLEKVRSGEVELSLRDRVKLRIVLRCKEKELAEELLAQAQVEGIVPVSVGLDEPGGTAAIDWDAFGDFIVKVLPAVLQIIQLFL